MEYSDQNLNKQEFQIRLEQQINIIRTNPISILPYLEDYLSKFDGKQLIVSPSVIMLTYEGQEGVQDAINFVKHQAPVNPIKLDKQLNEFSQFGSQSTGQQGGSGKLGTQIITQNIQNQNKLNNFAISCNLFILDFYGLNDPLNILLDMIIDDGNNSKSNRRNLFTPEFNVFGTGISFHKSKDFICHICMAQNTKRDSFFKIETSQIQQTINQTEQSEFISQQNSQYQKITQLNNNYQQNQKQDQNISMNDNYIIISNEICNLINKLRSNPLSFIPPLKEMIGKITPQNLYYKYQNNPIELEEGLSAVHETIQFLHNQHPVQPLERLNYFDKASEDHALDLGQNGLLCHESSDGKTMLQRLQKYDHSTYESLTELIDVEEMDPLEIVLKWLICDGEQTRENRKQLFNLGYMYIGVGGSDHQNYEYCFVVNLAGKIIKSSKLVDEFDDCDIEPEIKNQSNHINNQCRQSGMYNNLRTSNANQHMIDFHNQDFIPQEGSRSIHRPSGNMNNLRSSNFNNNYLQNNINPNRSSNQSENRISSINQIRQSGNFNNLRTSNFMKSIDRQSINTDMQNFYKKN